MSRICLDDINIETSGDLPEIGSNAPDFELITKDLSIITLENFAGKNIILNIFPSINTGTCAKSVEEFNKEASKLENTNIICASMDSPYAYISYCNSYDLNKNLIVGSDIRNRDLGTNYGVTIIDSPLAGLLARAIVVINKQHKVIYTELVSDLSNEPHYKAALEALKNDILSSSS